MNFMTQEIFFPKLFRYANFYGVLKNQIGMYKEKKTLKSLPFEGIASKLIENHLLLLLAQNHF